MVKISLNGSWQLRRDDTEEWLPAAVPGSVYADLLDAGVLEDPYWRDNEKAAFDLMEHDFFYRRSFVWDGQDCDEVLLSCEGLDTVAEVCLNGECILQADNMHRTWEVSVGKLLRTGENTLEIRFRSPNREVKARFARTPTYGTQDCTEGFPLLRKAHCMFGWDWGPRLPDAGIWRDISLLVIRKARLRSVFIRQTHETGAVTLDFAPEIERITQDAVCVRYRVTAPDGGVLETSDNRLRIEKPQLWWPHGYGSQPLYTVQAELLDENGACLDTWTRRIGLRTLTVQRKADEWGESFAPCVNGLCVFSMGADYIPEDNILRRVTPERTRRLLEDAVLANFNTVRVWGGGYYPDDWFYEQCDELGLLVWQDCMFACAMYELTPAFEANVRAELADNVRRLRHHPSLMLWCGNNEMEDGVMTDWYESTPKQKGDYVRLFQYIIPQAIAEYDPVTFYWPSSPSSGGDFDEPQAPGRGDVHDWSVWHRDLPFPAFRKTVYRFVSEFGFQSFPCGKTVESFTLPEDRNIFSRVMEKHQRNKSANGKIMNYMEQTFLYPTNFDTLLYASQLLQTEAVRYGVEHWRRLRGVCMGAVYWQLNDCWPVASWASIDYFGRWKALHYAAKRFFAPVLLSCEEHGTLDQRLNVNAEMPETQVERSMRLHVCNETAAPICGTVRWALRTPDGRICCEGRQDVEVPAYDGLWLEKQDFPEADLYGSYVSYSLEQAGEIVSRGTALFCAPKYFRFKDPHLTVTRQGDVLTVRADAYARSVEILCDDGDVLLEDNYFDLNADERSVRILRGSGTQFRVRSVYDIR